MTEKSHCNYSLYKYQTSDDPIFNWKYSMNLINLGELKKIAIHGNITHHFFYLCNRNHKIQVVISSSKWKLYNHETHQTITKPYTHPISKLFTNITA